MVVTDRHDMRFDNRPGTSPPPPLLPRGGAPTFIPRLYFVLPPLFLPCLSCHTTVAVRARLPSRSFGMVLSFAVLYFSPSSFPLLPCCSLNCHSVKSLLSIPVEVTVPAVGYIDARGVACKLRQPRYPCRIDQLAVILRLRLV